MAEDSRNDVTGANSQRSVLVIAHRGDSARAPENTLPAFQSAVAAGADLVELDYFHSADGVPIVFHDEQLDRTSDAPRVLGQRKLKVSEQTLAQLKRLDAGSWFAPEFAGTRIPTLAEALDVIQNGSVTLIEHKGGDAETLIELLRQRDELGDVVVQSFDWQFIADCHRLAPELRLTALGDKPFAKSKLDEIARTGAVVVGWNHKYLQASDIVEIHRSRLQVWVYTVDDRDRAQELIRARIDGIITNDPRAMLTLVGRS